MPPFRVECERDLEDLLRSLLLLHFDDIRLESRLPTYSPGNRSDVLLAKERIAITVKIAGRGVDEMGLAQQWKEDVAYYSRWDGWPTVVGFIYDPEGVIRNPGAVEAMMSECGEGQAFGILSSWKKFQ